jgi:hypothetical protein
MLIPKRKPPSDNECSMNALADSEPARTTALRERSASAHSTNRSRECLRINGSPRFVQSILAKMHISLKHFERRR